jgi:phospholipase C
MPLVRSALLLVACAVLAAALATSASGRRHLSLCGTGLAGTTVHHIVWIWMENHSYSQVIGTPGSTAYTNSPYVNGTLVPSCGLATNYHNVTHPSLPNYLAATSGSTQGVASDCSPSSCPQSAVSIFEQVKTSGHSWRSYEESMPSNCYKGSTTLYAAKHNPAVYYTRIAASCSVWDVPMGTTTSGAFQHALVGGYLPPFSLVTPNLCDDTHNCSVSTGDNWLKTWVPLITSGANYRSGDTVVFITWDEGSGGSYGESCATNTTDQSCHVATLVLSPSIKSGSRSSTLFNHYSLLKTAEQLLGLPYLGHAADSSTASMVSAFGLVAGKHAARHAARHAATR